MDDTFFQAMVVLLGFVLRLGIPLAVMMLLGHALRKLDQRWQAEATRIVERETALQKNHCWRVKNCDTSMIKKCPRFNDLSVPCWSFFQSNGTAARKCQDCVVWTQSSPMAALAKG